MLFSEKRETKQKKTTCIQSKQNKKNHFCIARGSWKTSTRSMMCTTPLVAALSADVTWAYLLIRTRVPYFSTSISLPSTVLNSWSCLRSLLKTAAPSTTWYSRTASSSLMCSGSSRYFRTAGLRCANASFVGAKTVKGPLLCSVVTSLPAVRAVTSVERSLTLSARATMSLVGLGAGGGEGAFGMSTRSMMCTTPLVASLSAAVTRDTVDVHLAITDFHQQFRTFEGLELVLGLEVLGVHSRTRHNVVLKNGIQRFNVFRVQQFLEFILGNLGERLV